ncbi:MAG: hypothetical protein KME10_13215 [Plectolyngbya sp. WJT66-NPBG17]|jgi:hypothetical protein|nr:hypothetical protein [Plectolyngbya sp. WJT66-NPBG17]MBW4525854.1 hypothetical protein [Phormidium tanganyikae FI6-MK23]
MSEGTRAVDKTLSQGTAGDRIRAIADQLRQETSLQIKATSRILGAAAQISENHDRLIDDVVEMVEEDLEQQTQPPISEAVTVERLQRQFKTLKQAKLHFGIKANTWALLADRLSQQSTVPNDNQVSVFQRLDAIEGELQAVRSDLNQALKVLELILRKMS